MHRWWNQGSTRRLCLSSPPPSLNDSPSIDPYCLFPTRCPPPPSQPSSSTNAMEMCKHSVLQILHEIQGTTTLICGQEVNRLKLATALVQATPAQMALKLMGCMFTKQEIANGTPTGTTTSKDERRIKTVQKLDPAIMKFIEGNNIIIIKVCIT